MCKIFFFFADFCAISLLFQLIVLKDCAIIDCLFPSCQLTLPHFINEEGS